MFFDIAANFILSTSGHCWNHKELLPSGIISKKVLGEHPEHPLSNGKGWTRQSPLLDVARESHYYVGR